MITIRTYWICVLLWLTTTSASSQITTLKGQLDSLLQSPTNEPFNGIVMISKKGKTLYLRTSGWSDIERKNYINKDAQFVVGSISKQFTAALVLQEVEKSRIDLHRPIRLYLPSLSQAWADTVTVHHLLTHTHGIEKLDRPTLFAVGTKYAYSQLGFELLAQIVAKTSGRSFAEQAQRLFKRCGMKNTFHPDTKQYSNLVQGYTQNEQGTLEKEQHSFQNYAAAGSFVSTVDDLHLWNLHFFKGKLLNPQSMQLLQTKHKGAVRNHPLFGVTEYGYGITVDTKEGLSQLGQTGYAPGFVSMNFYFPKTETSVIILSNFDYHPADLKKSFRYHTRILSLIRSVLLKH